METMSNTFSVSIEGNPFITRFKTQLEEFDPVEVTEFRIEGNPFITRFKTQCDYLYF